MITKEEISQAMEDHISNVNDKVGQHYAKKIKEFGQLFKKIVISTIYNLEILEDFMEQGNVLFDTGKDPLSEGNEAMNGIAKKTETDTEILGSPIIIDQVFEDAGNPKKSNSTFGDRENGNKFAPKNISQLLTHAIYQQNTEFRDVLKAKKLTSDSPTEKEYSITKYKESEEAADDATTSLAPSKEEGIYPFDETLELHDSLSKGYSLKIDMIENYKCSKCEYTSPIETKRDTHQRYCKEFSCPECNSAFNSKQSVATHVAAIHEKIKPYECENCKYVAADKSYLLRHVHRMHQKIKRFECRQPIKIRRKNPTGICMFKSHSKAKLILRRKGVHSGKPRKKAKEAVST